MDTYKLSSQDFEQMSKIIEITTSISIIYRKLYELEIEGKKDTKEYKNLLENLNNKIFEEEKLYQKCNIDYLKSTAWINYLSNYILDDNKIDYIESVMKQDESRVIRRIIKILLDKKEKEILIQKKDETIELMTQIGIENFTLESRSIHSDVELNKALEKDLLNSYLVFLEDFLQKQEYRKFKNQLIKSKYDIAFINKDVEKDMIYSRYEISKDIYLNSRFIADLLKIDLMIYNISRRLYGIMLSSDHISKMLEINDIDYSDDNKTLESIYRQCLIKATLLFMEDKDVTEVNCIFSELIKFKDYLNDQANNRISGQLVANCFEDAKKDKEKAKILSFGYRN